MWTGPREEPRRYRIDLVDGAPVSVGAGGEGLVYQATVMVDGQERAIALKMHTALTADDFERFGQRARALSAIDHPNVMRLVDTFVGTALIDDPDPAEDEFSIMYTAAEWVPGLSLPAALAATSKGSGLHWVAQVARAAEYLHTFRSPELPAGVVHRDIKPSNVRVTPDEDAVLIDFGIARPHQAGDHTEGAGTFMWKAPEVVGGPGDPGPASDVWGIGALGYWLFVGEPPRLDGAAAARDVLVTAARQAGFPDAKGLSRSIADLLEIHPQNRPVHLAGWADEMDVRATGRRPRQRARVAAVAASLVVLAGALTVTALLVGRAPSPSPVQSGQVGAEAVKLLPSDVGLGTLLAVASYRLAPTRGARQALIESIERPVAGVLHDGSRITALAYSANGRRLVTADGAGTVVLWDSATRTRLASVALHHPLSAIALSPDGQVVAVGDRAGTVELWNTQRLTDHPPSIDIGRKVTSVAFSANGSLVAVGGVFVNDKDLGNQGDITVWNPGDRQTRAMPVPRGASVTSVAFDPDDEEFIVAGDAGGQVDLWHTAPSSTGYFSTGFARPVTSIAFSGDGRSIVTGDDGGHVALWTAAGAQLAAIAHDHSPINAVAFDSVGTTVLVEDTGGQVTRWNTTSGAPIGPALDVGAGITGVAFSPAGQSVATADGRGDAVLWTLALPGETLASPAANSVVDSVAFSRAGDLLATADQSGDVVLWNTATGSVVRQLPGDGSQVYSVAIAPDGFMVATGDENGKIGLWDTLTGTETHVISDRYRVYSVAFSPDGRTLVSGDAGDRAMLWSTATGDPIGRPLFDPRHTGISVRTVAFSPGGAMVATGDDAGYVTLWRTDSQTKVRPALLVAAGRIVRSVAFNPDGSLVAAGGDNGYAELWNVKTGGLVRRFGPEDDVLSVAFGDHGRTLSTGTDQGRIVTWEVAGGSETAVPYVVGGTIFGLAFNSDGSTLAAVNDSSTTTLIPSIVVDEPTSALAQHLCAEIRGNLTALQWSADIGDAVPYRQVCPGY